MAYEVARQGFYHDTVAIETSLYLRVRPPAQVYSDQYECLVERHTSMAHAADAPCFTQGLVERPAQHDYVIQPIAEFAKVLTKVERYPKLGFYDYGFPKEFVEMKY